MAIKEVNEDELSFYFCWCFLDLDTPWSRLGLGNILYTNHVFQKVVS